MIALNKKFKIGIIAIVISICIGMDTLTWQKVLAAIMVFGGVIIVSYSKSKVERI